MELDGLILLLIRRINFMCLLGLYGNFEESEKLLDYLCDCFKVIQSYYPHKVGGAIGPFELFVSEKEIKSKGKNEKRIVGLRFASYITLCFFKKKWSKLIRELSTEEGLRLPGTYCFKKILLMFKECSELYYGLELQAYHYYHCSDPRLHTTVTAYYFRVAKYHVIKKLYDEKTRKSELDKLLFYYPFLKNRMIKCHKSDFQQTKVNSSC